MTLATASLIAVAWIHWIEVPAASVKINGVEAKVQSIQQNQLETRLDQAYAALCMSPGDNALLERIRELQGQYWDVTGRRYPQPDCSLLLKLK